jgi:hypothetical protein
MTTDRPDAPASLEGCMICGATLVYSTTASAQVCDLCGREESAMISCPGGHFVCDACHRATVTNVVRRVLETTESTDPSAILEQILALPTLTMHGPEHHAIVPGVIIASAGNAGVALPPGGLDAALRRGGKVPGGWCGYYGACGAAVGVGVAVSVITEATPLKGEPRSQALAATAFALTRMIDGQPRCCKRASRVAVAAAVEYLRDQLGLDLPAPGAVRCTSAARNKECPGESCPYFVAIV